MGLFFTILFVFALYVRPQEWVEILLNSPVIDFTAAGAIAFVFLEGSFNKQKFVRSPINKNLAIFWVWLAVTTAATGYIGGFTSTLQTFGRVAILYYLIVLTVTNFKQLKLLLWCLILLSTFLSIEAVIQFYTGFSLVGATALERHVGDEAVAQARGIGIFSDPNDLALHVVPMLAFLLPAFHKRNLSGTVITGILVLIPLVTGVVYTRSRGGILAMAFVVWIYLRHRVGLTFSVVGLVMLFGLLMAIPRFDTTGSGSGTAQSRLDHWAYGLDQFKQHPVFGMGWRCFTEQGYRHTAHNSFVLVLAETGLVGALLWISFFYIAAKHIFAMQRITRGPPWLEPMSKALEGAVGGWMVAGFFLSQAYGFILYMLFAIVVATVNILGNQGIEVGVTWTKKDLRNVFFITAGMIVIIHLMCSLLFVAAI